MVVSKSVMTTIVEWLATVSLNNFYLIVKTSLYFFILKTFSRKKNCNGFISRKKILWLLEQLDSAIRVAITTILHCLRYSHSFWQHYSFLNMINLNLLCILIKYWTRQDNVTDKRIKMLLYILYENLRSLRRHLSFYQN